LVAAMSKLSGFSLIVSNLSFFILFFKRGICNALYEKKRTSRRDAESAKDAKKNQGYLSVILS